MYLGTDDSLGWYFDPVRTVVLYAVLWLLLMDLAQHCDAIIAPDSSLLLLALTATALADQISNPPSRKFDINPGVARRIANGLMA